MSGLKKRTLVFGFQVRNEVVRDSFEVHIPLEEVPDRPLFRSLDVTDERDVIELGGIESGLEVEGAHAGAAGAEFAVRAGESLVEEMVLDGRGRHERLVSVDAEGWPAGRS